MARPRRHDGVILAEDDPAAVELRGLIQAGELERLGELLERAQGLSCARIRRRGGTVTPLHLASEWPGYLPRAPEVVRLLVEHGADPNAVSEGRTCETPLHLAASSDDSDVAIALIAAGAEIEVPGGSIGTPLDNAVGYGCWHVASLLLERGARVGDLWQAAALGLADRVEELLAAEPPPGQEELDHAFWQACHGGQRRTAERLLARGADIDATPWHSTETPLDIVTVPDTRRATLTAWLRDQGAHGAAVAGD